MSIYATYEVNTVSIWGREWIETKKSYTQGARARVCVCETRTSTRGDDKKNARGG